MCSAGKANATQVSENLTTVIEKENEETPSVDGENGKKVDSVHITTVGTIYRSEDRVVQVKILFVILIYPSVFFLVMFNYFLVITM